jgi:hypothetical protein
MGQKPSRWKIKLSIQDRFWPLLVVAWREKKRKGTPIMAEQLMETTVRTAL